MIHARPAICPEAVGGQLAAGLPQARFQALEGCGHLPTLERPVESAASFRALLSEI